MQLEASTLNEQSRYFKFYCLFYKEFLLYSFVGISKPKQEASAILYIDPVAKMESNTAKSLENSHGKESISNAIVVFWYVV